MGYLILERVGGGGAGYNSIGEYYTYEEECHYSKHVDQAVTLLR